MRCLVLSDVGSWQDKQQLLDPGLDAVLLGGDLVHDGHLRLHTYGEEGRRHIRHVESFYGFVEAAAALMPVFIARGNHDLARHGFDTDRLDIPNVHLVSDGPFRLGRHTIGGMDFPGRQPRRTIRRSLEPADILVTHIPHQHLDLLRKAEPRMVLQGHNGVGEFHRKDVSYVLTSRAHHGILTLKKRKVHCDLYDRHGRFVRRRSAKKGAGLE